MIRLYFSCLCACKPIELQNYSQHTHANLPVHGGSLMPLPGLSHSFLTNSLQNLRDLMGYVQAYLKKPKAADRVTSLGVSKLKHNSTVHVPTAAHPHAPTLFWTCPSIWSSHTAWSYSRLQYFGGEGGRVIDNLYLSNSCITTKWSVVGDAPVSALQRIYHCMSEVAIATEKLRSSKLPMSGPLVTRLIHYNK